MIYARVVKPLLFRLDPERSHDLALTSLAVAGRVWTRVGAGDRVGAVSVHHRSEHC